MAGSTFVNFCCRSGGSNLNSGTRRGDQTVPGPAAAITYAGGTYGGANGIFTPASGNPITDGIAVGDWVSIYTAGATDTGFIGRITTVTATNFTVSASALAGVNPAAGTRTAKIGGAWSGPSAANAFPYSLGALNTLTDSSNNRPRINLKNDQTLTLTVGVNQQGTGVTTQGFAASYGDGGRAVVDGGTVGPAYRLWFLNGTGQALVDVELKNNGASGGGVELLGFNWQGNVVSRCVIRDCRGNGAMVQAGTSAIFETCEFYGSNQSNTPSQGALYFNGGPGQAVNCIFHDNAGNFTGGALCSLSTTAQVSFNKCIFDSNGGRGLAAGPNAIIDACEFYSNGGGGLAFTTGAAAIVRNCNFVKNTGYGIDLSAGGILGRIVNCGFGSGTQANTVGQVNNPSANSVLEVGTVTYAADATPWQDPASGDFRVTLAAAKGTGAGAYLQTMAGYGGTVGYPDLGAAQHLEAASAPPPAVGDVRLGVVYGAFTGTLALPAVGKVRAGTGYGAGGAELAGTDVLPLEPDVRAPVGYGADALEFTGTLIDFTSPGPNIGAREVQLGDAVVAMLGGALPGETVVRTDIPVEDLADFDERRIYVFVAGYSDSARLTRSMNYADAPTAVLFAEKYEPAALADPSGPIPVNWLDDRRNTTATLFALMNETGVKQATRLLGSFWPETCALTTPVDLTRLDQQKVFWSLIEVGYREFRRD